MILIAHQVGSRELLPLIHKIGIPADIAQLEYGDFAFEGNGPGGYIDIGIERKTLHDMLACIDDSRYSAHQLPGMKKMYHISILMVEGLWKAHDPEGWLMEMHNGAWHPCRPGGRRVLYSKLRRYLFSVALSGVLVMQTRSMWETAYDICELYQYFSKSWDKHTALREKQKVVMPSLNSKLSLVERWAGEIDGIGVKFREAAVTRFKTGLELAESEEQDWRELGLGAATAKKVVQQIRGMRR